MSTARSELGLGELESAVLSELWDRGPMNTPRVFNGVGVPRGLAYTTILTVLQRLWRKGLVQREVSGRSHSYRAAVTRDGLAQRRGQELAEALVSLESAGVIAFVAATHELSPELVTRLKDYLDQDPEQ